MACGCCGQKYRPPQGAVSVTQARVALPRRRRAVRGVIKTTPPAAPVQEETPVTPTPVETKDEK